MIGATGFEPATFRPSARVLPDRADRVGAGCATTQFRLWNYSWISPANGLGPRPLRAVAASRGGEASEVRERYMRLTTGGLTRLSANYRKGPVCRISLLFSARAWTRFPPSFSR